MKNNYLNIIKEYNVKSFYHFTNISNLESILNNGICNREYMDTHNITYSFTDAYRFDNQMRCISLSLNTVNKSMITSKSNILYNDWIIFELNAYKIINRFYDNAYYCMCNASSPSVIRILKNNKEYLKTIIALKKMFSINGAVNNQAEILIEGIIPCDYIENIYVNSLQTKLITQQILLNSKYEKIPVVIRKELF